MTTTKPLRIAVSGAMGRMGRAVAAAADEKGLLPRPVEVVARIDRPEATDPGLMFWADALKIADVVVDFSSPNFSTLLAERCAEEGRPALVIGSTGFQPAQEKAIARAAERVAIVKSGNYSVGVNILLGMVRQTAAKLAPSYWDIEVSERHHRRKVDAPSGTALMLGQAAAEGRKVSLDACSVRARDGLTGEREAGTIGFSVVRAGGIIGEHSVLFASEDEVLTFSHTALSRFQFAKGALAAAMWAQAQPPGLYDMQDVLGLKPS